MSSGKPGRDPEVKRYNALMDRIAAEIPLYPQLSSPPTPLDGFKPSLPSARSNFATPTMALYVGSPRTEAADFPYSGVSASG